jgi:hypothetical protein
MMVHLASRAPKTALTIAIATEVFGYPLPALTLAKTPTLPANITRPRRSRSTPRRHAAVKTQLGPSPFADGRAALTGANAH